MHSDCPLTKAMKAHKPDLNEKISIRISTDLKRQLAFMCEEHDLDEALVMRLALEAGIELAKKKGVGAMLEARKEGISFRRPTPKQPTPKNAKPAFIITKNAQGTGWTLSDKAGKKLLSGPLYDARRKAKFLRSDGEAIEIRNPDGTKEVI